jgi:alpha-galactosidase
MDDPPAIRGFIDGFEPPATLRGWAVKQAGEAWLADLAVELRRGDTVIASAVPTEPRPDVTRGDTPAGFRLRLPEGTTAQELLTGAVQVLAVDPQGNAAPVTIWQPTRTAIRQEAVLGGVRGADPALAQAIIQTLADSLGGEAGEALRQAGRTAVRRRAPRAGGPKIAFIGAGSTVFARNLLGDILLHPALAASRIWLYDIDPVRLRESATVAGRIRIALGSPATIESTLDLGAALDGADFAITMIQVGGYRPCTVTDFELPKRFGLRQTIADTLGIGGIMRGLRTIPVLLDLVREMERRCPDVLHLNYSNPMAMNCWAMARASRVQSVGLCHSVPLTAADMAADIGVPAEAVDYLAAGINHMAFYLRFQAEGQDLYPRLHQVIADGRVPPHNRVRYDMLRRLGYFVTESSEHFAEYVPWYIKRDRPDLIERFGIPLDEYPRRCESQIADWARTAESLADPAMPLPVRQSHEYASTIINARCTGEPALVYGNVPNGGVIANLPADCCVEVPCLVDANGLRPVQVGALPPHLAALMQTNINVQALTVEAALTGRREHVYHAAMLDPHTAAELDLDQIWSLVDAMLEAHGVWVPEPLRTAG